MSIPNSKISGLILDEDLECPSILLAVIKHSQFRILVLLVFQPHIWNSLPNTETN